MWNGDGRRRFRGAHSGAHLGCGGDIDFRQDPVARVVRLEKTGADLAGGQPSGDELGRGELCLGEAVPSERAPLGHTFLRIGHSVVLDALIRGARSLPSVLNCSDDADEKIRGGQERSEHKALVRRQLLPCCSVLLRGVVHRE
jgi:hypothetical protein